MQKAFDLPTAGEMTACAIVAKKTLMLVLGGVAGLAIERYRVRRPSPGYLIENSVIHAHRANVSALMFDMTTRTLLDVDMEVGRRLHQQFWRKSMTGDACFGLDTAIWRMTAFALSFEKSVRIRQRSWAHGCRPLRHCCASSVIYRKWNGDCCDNGQNSEYQISD